MGIASVATLRAQAAGGLRDICADPCCLTDVLLLNTGYDHINGGVYGIGATDAFWHVVHDGFGPTPRAANVTNAPDPQAATQPGTQWIRNVRDGYDPTYGEVTYEKCFCVCQTTTLTFTLNVIASGDATISVDGAAIGNLAAGTDPTLITATVTVDPGVHCIEVTVTADDANIPNGFDLQGTVVGPGLVKYECCNNVIDGDCETPRLTIATDSTWRLTSGAGPGPFPRAASVIWSWGSSIPGANWIGANPNGTSVNKVDAYNYRKCFCMNQAGTVAITMTVAADDSCAVYLDGLYIMTFVPNYAAPTTQTLIVALDAGCNCFDFLVYDLGGSITGLDALIDMQGSHIAKPECCDFDCDRSQPRAQGGGNALAGAAGRADAHSTMMLAIPNPTSGMTTIHYVLEREGQISLNLYDAAGQVVRSLDGGLRAAGEHRIELDAKALPAGAYYAVLNVGGKKFTVPVSVR